MLRSDCKSRGKDYDENNAENIELIQSVIGHYIIVELIQTQPFHPNDYSIKLITAIDEVKRTLFPDIRKNRYFSFDDDRFTFLLDCEYTPEDTEFNNYSADNFATISDHLSQSTYIYLKNKLLQNYPHLRHLVSRIPGNNQDFHSFVLHLEKKLQLFQKFFPDGKINFINQIDPAESLSKNEIIDCYLQVYLDIEKFFPANFLQTEGKKRSAILTRFLIEEILETQAEEILNQKDETFFIKHKLQNVYRLFNYSFNRVLGNAYPDLIPPWLQSRTSTNYWKQKGNRIQAVRWLIERQLGINQNKISESSVSRSLFAEFGLSYLFNTYYNSVSAALSEAYPEKEPWEIGNVPITYWTTDNCARAVRWLVAKKGWQVNELPQKVRSKKFNRKTFSEFGLATLFEKKCGKNIYKAVSMAWPGKFQPWEFGKVSSHYWKKVTNVFHASKWIAGREGIDERNIISAIRNNRLTFSDMKKYSIGQVLKKLSKGNIENLFSMLFWKEHQTYLEEQKILRKIKAQNRQYARLNIFRIILYGMFAGEVARNHHRQQRAYRRISQRISAGYFL